jgi:pimeloyl-ACP methyl ester carboxylesterase
MTAKTRHVDAHAGVTNTKMTAAVPRHDGAWRRAGLLKTGDVSLFAEVRGQGYPLVVMHGGPSADHFSMLPFRQLADQFTVILYDHRCNGRSVGAPVSSMTWENLTADAEALRQRLGFERWAVVGHSFGGHVALEYALRYPASLSHLVLLNTSGDARWEQQNAAGLLAQRGYSPRKTELVRRWFNGELTPREYFPMFMRVGAVYALATAIVVAGFGMASSLAIRGIEQNHTPWAGGFERIDAYAYFAWLVVLAVMVIRHELGPTQTTGELGGSRPEVPIAA